MKENYHSQTADDRQTSEMKQAKKIGKWFGLGIVAALTLIAQPKVLASGFSLVTISQRLLTQTESNLLEKQVSLIDSDGDGWEDYDSRIGNYWIIFSNQPVIKDNLGNDDYAFIYLGLQTHTDNAGFQAHLPTYGDRTSFGNHAFVRYTVNQKIYDSCAHVQYQQLANGI